jgi:zinc transporter ZupT
MRWLLLFPGISLVTASVMLYLAFCDILDDLRRRKPRWKVRHSLDVIALSIGFICMIVTSLYVLIVAVILW